MRPTQKSRQKLQEIRPETFQAYPSTAAQFADLIIHHEDQGKFTFFNAILLGAENIYPWQLEKIRQAFPDAKIAGHYGLTEQVCMGAWCEQTDDYHIWPFYGLTELIEPEDAGRSSAQTMEVVATSFWNRATPFIRYRTGDLACYKGDRCPACGRRFDIFSKIEGRRGDFVVDRESRLISLTALVFGQHLHTFTDIKNIQIVQDTPGQLLVRVEPNSAFNEKDASEIRRALEKVTAGQMDITVEKTDQLAQTHRGEHAFLIQNVPLSSYSNLQE